MPGRAAPSNPDPMGTYSSAWMSAVAGAHVLAAAVGRRVRVYVRSGLPVLILQSTPLKERP